ncbi:hypothetical protein YSY43_00210 [Paenibacillus sp. YSY-4.3]
MLTFQQKIQILESFPQLERRDVSLGRVNFHYEGSVHDKKTVGYHLHPNGNGFIYAGLLDHLDVNDKGFVNIRDFTEPELRQLVQQSIDSLSGLSTGYSSSPVPAAASGGISGIDEQSAASGHNSGEELWHDPEGTSLLLKPEDDLWYVYAGSIVEMVFETREEAEEYLREEGFTP